MKKVKIISLLVLLLSASTLSAVERDTISKTNFPIVNGWWFENASKCF